MVGYVNSIETFGAVDGPGVRFIFFLQGCRMRCKYCHNPETWRLPDELLEGKALTSGAAAGKEPEPSEKEAVHGLEGDTVHGSSQAAEASDHTAADSTNKTIPWRKDAGEKYDVVTPEAAFAKAWRYHAYWKNGGGITVSGGEALLQIDFVTDLFRIAKEHGVNTALDTSGNPFTREEPFFSKFNELMKYTDLYILDIKQIYSDQHRKLTGWGNENILDMARYLSDNGKDMWIRHVLVPGFTTDEQELRDLRSFIDTLKTVKRVEVLPYHTMGKMKYENLGIAYPIPDTEPPTSEQIELAEKILRTHGN